MSEMSVGVTPSRRAVKLVGGVLLVGAGLVAVGYGLGYDTLSLWTQLAGTLVSALLGG